MTTHHRTSPHDSKYAFTPPESIKEAQDRSLILLRDIWNIEKQLTDPSARLTPSGEEMTAREYSHWYSRIRASLIYKQFEKAKLKQWIKERREEVALQRLSIVEDDPRSMLIAARTALRKALDGDQDDPYVGKVFTAIERHLLHAA
jgi:hypothetical protein